MSRPSLSMLAARCRVAETQIARIGSEWQHYSGGYYRVTGFGIDEPTGDVEVQYEPISITPSEHSHLEGLTFHRKAREWHELVNDGLITKPRFRRVVRTEQFVEA